MRRPLRVFVLVLVLLAGLPVLHGPASASDEGTIDGVNGTGPTISSIDIVSDPGSDDTYQIGDIIEIYVTFSEGIDVLYPYREGDRRIYEAPQLEVDVGGVPRTFRYLGTVDPPDSGTRYQVVFVYTVAADDVDHDGISIGENKLTGGRIVGDSGPADTTHPAIPADDGHKVVDGVAPTVSSIAITSKYPRLYPYKAGEAVKVKVTFSEDVIVTGVPQLELEIGRTGKAADYESVDGNTATFSYTVVAGDEDVDGIAIGADKISLNGGTIKDAAGHSATLAHDAVSDNASHKVDAVVPTVKWVTITSDPGNDDTYGLGDRIEVTVTFTEVVKVEFTEASAWGGNPEIELDFDGTAKTAAYDSNQPYTGKTVILVYTVQVGDKDSDGIAIGADKLVQNLVYIKDLTGNNADLAHRAVAPDGHRVNAPGGL